MNCTIACVMSAAFQTASFMTMVKTKKGHNEFKKSLDKKQLKVYKKIKLERLMIWLKASVMGVMLSLLYRTNYYHFSLYCSIVERYKINIIFLILK